MSHWYPLCHLYYWLWSCFFTGSLLYDEFNVASLYNFCCHPKLKVHIFQISTLSYSFTHVTNNIIFNANIFSNKYFLTLHYCSKCVLWLNIKDSNETGEYLCDVPQLSKLHVLMDNKYKSHLLTRKYAQIFFPWT